MTRMQFQHLHHVRRDEGEGEIGVGFPDPIGNEAGNVLEPLARCQRFEPGLGFARRVLIDAADGDDLAAGVSNREVLRAVEGGAVVGLDDVFAGDRSARHGHVADDLAEREMPGPIGVDAALARAQLQQALIGAVGVSELAVEAGDIHRRAVGKQGERLGG